MKPPLISRRSGHRSPSQDDHRCQRARLIALSFAAALGALWPAARLLAVDLVVDGANQSSPYGIASGAQSYNNVYVGQNTLGMLNQSGGTLNVTTGQLFLGANAGAIGLYNLSGGTLNTISTDVGDSGTGTFTLSGSGVHNVTGTDGSANGSLDLAFFSGSNGTYNLNGGTLIAGYVAGGQGTSTFNFNGGTLTAAASTTNFLQGLTSANVRAGGAVINTAGFNVTIAQNLVSGTAVGTPDGGLTKQGAGTLTLTGTNTYTGGTAFAGGVLNVASAGALGSSGVLSFTGGILQYSAASAGTDFSPRFSSGGNQAIALDTNGQDVTIGTSIVGSGTSLTKRGAGTLTINVNNTYTGGARLFGGTVVVNTPGALGSSGTINISGGTLRYGNTSFTDAQYNAVDYSARFGQGVDQTYTIDTNGRNITYGTGLGSSNGTLTKLGAGTLTLSGTGNYSGPTQVTGGTLQAGAANAFGSNSAVTLANTAGVALDLNGYNQVIGSLAGSGNMTLNNSALTVGGNNASTVYAGAISGGGSLTKNGTGTFTLAGTNTYTGTTRVNAGTLAVTGSVSGGTLLLLSGDSAAPPVLSLTGSLNVQTASVGLGGAGTLTQNGGTFTTGSLIVGNLTGIGIYNLNTGNLSATSSAVVGTAGGNGTFNQNGGSFTTNGNPLSLGVNDTSNGTTSPSSGTYTLGGGTLTVGSIAGGGDTSIFHFAGGTLRASGSTGTFLQGLNTTDVQGNGGAIIDTQGNDVTVAQRLLHDTSSATATDDGLTKLGAGTLTLTGNNTYTGATTIRAGTLSVAADNNLGAAGNAVYVFSGTSLVYTGSTATTGRTFNLINGTLGVASGSTLTYNGATVNGGTLGAGNHILRNGTALNGVRTTTGTVLSQSNGTVAWNNVTLGGNSTFTQTAGATLNSTGEFITTPNSTMTVSGAVNTAGGSVSGAVTINNGGVVNTSGGAAAPLYLDGSRGTTVNAGGRLSAASGSTVELGGLLVNNGTQSGTLNVNLGGVARGTGTFGTVNVGNGGRFGVNTLVTGSSPNGLSVIHLTGADGLARTAFVGPQLAATPGKAYVTSLALGSGSVFAFSVQDAANTNGNGYDTVSASGALTLSAGTTAGNQITLTVTSLAADGTAGQAGNFDPTRNYAFLLVSAPGGITGYSAGEFTVDTSGFQNATNGGSFSVVQQGNNLVLAYSAVPEPSTWVLLGLGIGLGLIVQRQRRVSA